MYFGYTSWAWVTYSRYFITIHIYLLLRYKSQNLEEGFYIYIYGYKKIHTPSHLLISTKENTRIKMYLFCI